MGTVAVALFGRERRWVTDRDDCCDLPANQVFRQFRQAIDLIVGPAVFDRHIVALDQAGVSQT
jgi:hypothetical protein